MLSLSTARQLKEAGLAWTPALNDFFAIPDRGMDERVFVITDMFANVELLRGFPIVTFHGAAEWALDYVLTTELVWLPAEAQLREALERRLRAETRPEPEGQGQPWLKLASRPGGYLCEIQFRGQALAFGASEAGEAYAAALLHVLRNA